MYIQLVHGIMVQRVTEEACMDKRDKQGRAACVRVRRRNRRQRHGGGGAGGGGCCEAPMGDQAAEVAEEGAVKRYVFTGAADGV